MSTEKTLGELTREYLDLFKSAPDGLGQHVHPVYGASHMMLIAMVRRFGINRVQDAVADELAARNAGKEP